MRTSRFYSRSNLEFSQLHNLALDTEYFPFQNIEPNMRNTSTTNLKVLEIQSPFEFTSHNFHLREDIQS